MYYTAIMRPGRTRTTSFSLDEETLRNLKALAARRHRGNVSVAKYDVPPLPDAAADAIEAEWRPAPRKRARNGAA
jgi:hypothetical protein